jgi:hypothetical protein
LTSDGYATKFGTEQPIEWSSAQTGVNRLSDAKLTRTVLPYTVPYPLVPARLMLLSETCITVHLLRPCLRARGVETEAMALWAVGAGHDGWLATRRMIGDRGKSTCCGDISTVSRSVCCRRAEFKALLRCQDHHHSAAQQAAVWFQQLEQEGQGVVYRYPPWPPVMPPQPAPPPPHEADDPEMQQLAVQMHDD